MSSIGPQSDRGRKRQEKLEAEASRTSPLPPGAPSRKLRVFLCHAFEDKAMVSGLYQLLIKDGADAWLDEENLIAGQAWEREIENAVRASDVVVVCLSRVSITREGYVQKEIRYALNVAEEKPEDTIFLIPAKLEECEVPPRLKDKHWVALFQTTGYEKLMKALIKRAEALKVIPPASFQSRPVPQILQAAAVGKAVLVLGRFPENFLKQAALPNAKVFDIPDDWDGMTTKERWEANRKFIDEAIERDDVILLTTALERIPVGSYLEKELEYLFSHGFEFEMRLVRREE